jgi:hypothetical protein
VNLLPSLGHQFTYLPSGYATIFYVQVFGEVAEGIRVSSAVYYSPPMQRLVQATNDVISWHNDIYSFQKVILVHEHNLCQSKICSGQAHLAQ